MVDVITFGECLVRLTPTAQDRLDRAHTLAVEVGGAELNTAAGLICMGDTAAWASVLPANPLGKLVAGRVREAGVDDRFIQFSNAGRQGLYFLEEGAAPRASEVHYDRQNSAFSQLSPLAFDWSAVLVGVKAVHVTGITPALGVGPAQAALALLKAAKTVGLSTSFDLNYRSKLWSAKAAGETIRPMLSYVDTLIASEGDCHALFGISGDFASMAQSLIQTFGITHLAALRRDATQVQSDTLHAVGYSHGTLYQTPTVNVEVVDRLGAGDAFAAGLIHELLANDFVQGLHTGTAMAALKHTVRGDMPRCNFNEVEAVFKNQRLGIRR